MIDFTINSVFNSICYQFGEIVIDPGDIWDGFYGISTVLLTHVHFDHIYGLNELFKINPEAIVYTNEAGRMMLLDSKKNMSYYHETPFVFDHPARIRVVKDGDELRLNDRSIVRAVFTPGHNPSCITWLIGQSIFTGDAYIPGIKTVTNLPGGNREEAAKSIEIIKELADGRHIYPGHKI